ncbi:MAG: hypothetical protein KatS3mg082_1044 [Nitrospiraceae bacterium]|nr:MAG: hypothetical protein KatS3mg082_1044 [Nitrospiraceae bacterium]
MTPIITSTPPAIIGCTTTPVHRVKPAHLREPGPDRLEGLADLRVGREVQADSAGFRLVDDPMRRQLDCDRKPDPPGQLDRLVRGPSQAAVGEGKVRSR